MSQDKLPHILYEDHRPWKNHHENVQFVPARQCDVWNFWDDNSRPETRSWTPGLTALKRIIRDAEKSREEREVRALGGGWSLSGAAETAGILVNTKPLNIIQIGVHQKHCHTRFLSRNGKGEHRQSRLVFAQCGATIAELNQALEDVGLSLSTSGASNGQTICGAMSTGTHGAAWQLPNGGSVQDYIVGLHLLGPDSKSLWIQSEKNPVVNRGFCDVLDPDIVLLESDDVFNAARVAFGSFGIIHAVLLEAVPIFLLERHICPLPFAEVAPVLDNLTRVPELRLTDINGRIPYQPPYHIEVLINPYAFECGSGALREIKGRKSTYVRYMFKRPQDWSGTLGGPFVRMKPENTTISNDIMAVIAKFSSACAIPGIEASGALDHIVGSILEGELKGGNGDDQIGTVLTHGGTFSATQLAGSGLSMELGFDLNDVPRALEVIVHAMQDFPFASIPALRYVSSSEASLAFTKFPHYTCTIEFPAPLASRSVKGYQQIWSKLDNAKVPFTFHWGQWMDLQNSRHNLERLRQSYGDRRLRNWFKARKMVLPRKQDRILFSNKMTRSLGLEDDANYSA